MIDLHVHSTFSDGSETPMALAVAAASSGLTAMALTDHDTMRGVNPFLEACSAHGLRGIAGVEVSAEYSHGTMHILGYLVQPGNVELENALESMRAGRGDRNQVILEKLNALGLVMTWDEVAAKAGEDVVGRPHFAMVMLDKGYVKTKEEAFDRYLAKGKVAYVDRIRLTPENSIALIRAAGGVAVLAHPFTLDYSNAELRRLLAHMVEVGLGGLEVYYSEYTAEQHHHYVALAREYGLVMTGGSDYHGSLNPDIALGRGFGNLKVPDELIAPLYARAGRQLA